MLKKVKSTELLPGDKLECTSNYHIGCYKKGRRYIVSYEFFNYHVMCSNAVSAPHPVSFFRCTRAGYMRDFKRVV